MAAVCGSLLQYTSAADGGVPMTARRALPPIRTLTVGPGISPGQPTAGCGRVADFNRRFGCSTTPECAYVTGTELVCHARSRPRGPSPVACATTALRRGNALIIVLSIVHIGR